MLIIIRNNAKLSRKTKFIIQLIRQSSHKQKILCVFKKENEKFCEKRSCDYVQLPYSIMGIITYYSLIMLRSPEEFRNALIRRLSNAKPKHVLAETGFLSMLRNALYLRFGSSARADSLLKMLNNLKSPKVFLVDEFKSLNCIDLKKLRLLGSIIYVSQDVAYNQYGFQKSFITRKLMFRLERDAIANVDLVVACSETEKLKYLDMGAKKAIFYPNIYPTKKFEPDKKDEIPSISIILRDHWGFRAKQSLRKVFNAIEGINRQLKVCLIGMKPPRIPNNITLEHHRFIQSKMDYLKLLSRSWIGINIGIHMAGTNERKYDYAEAGLVVFSDTIGVRGDLLPNEFSYVDSHDLTAKLKQLLEFDSAMLFQMGKANRSQVLSLAEKERLKTFGYLSQIVIDNEQR